jgi:hypothetical protein
MVGLLCGSVGCDSVLFCVRGGGVCIRQANGGCVMNVQFLNGKSHTKAQLGLR